MVTRLNQTHYNWQTTTYKITRRKLVHFGRKLVHTNTKLVLLQTILVHLAKTLTFKRKFTRKKTCEYSKRAA